MRRDRVPGATVVPQSGTEIAGYNRTQPDKVWLCKRDSALPCGRSDDSPPCSNPRNASPPRRGVFCWRGLWQAECERLPAGSQPRSIDAGPRGELAQNRADGDARVTNAGKAPHSPRISGDSSIGHWPRIRRPARNDQSRGYDSRVTGPQTETVGVNPCAMAQAEAVRDQGDQRHE